MTKMNCSLNPDLGNTEGWIGNPLDPIGSLFDTLAEASLTPDSKPLEHYYPTFLVDSSQSSVNNSSMSTGVHSQEEASFLNPLHPISNHVKPRYIQVPVSGPCEQGESYLALAVEAALIGLGQQRLMPSGTHAQEKATRQETSLITKLQDIELDSHIVSVLRKQGRLLLEGGPFSGLGLGIHPESVPMHNFARYLFNSLLRHDPELAFSIGLRAMRYVVRSLSVLGFLSASRFNSELKFPFFQRLPILENIDNSDVNSNNHYGSNQLRNTRWTANMKIIEEKQRALAATMLCAAKDDDSRLKKVLLSAQANLHSFSQLFELARSAFIAAKPDNSRVCRNPNLLSAAYELGLQVMKMTLAHMGSTESQKRQTYVEWMVDCATEFGIKGLITLMHSWSELFTPVEACKFVAPRIMNHSLHTTLQLRFEQQTEVSNCARNLALQCAEKDPSNCALCALKLCEQDPYAFNHAFTIIQNAGQNGVMGSTQLFEVAKYIEGARGMGMGNCSNRAYSLALLAVRNVQIPANGENHQAAQDINWAFNLALLNRDRLAQLIPVLVKNVHCATILASILHKCTIGPGTTFNCMDVKRRCLKALHIDKTPLRQLLEAAITAFIQTTHSRLTHISPRHYSDFIDFLGKARETFSLAQDGNIQFNQLIDDMKSMYKGKKKLMFMVKERFG